MATSLPPDPSELGFRLLVDSIPGMVCTMGATGEVEFVNRRILDYMGMTLDEIAGWRSTLHEEDRDRVIDLWNQSIATGNPYDVEHRIRAADGSYRWFHVRGVALRADDGRILRWYMLLTDIDDRKRAEDARRESERALLLITESIPGMITVHGPAGDLEYVNQRLLDYAGAELADLTNLGWARVLHPEDADAVVAEWLRALQTHQPVDLTFRIRRADGVFRWFHARAAPLFDSRGRIVRWYSLFWDIEETKQAEIALRERERELRQLVDSFPGMVAVANAAGQHEYANKRAMDYVGKELSEVANLGWTDDIHPDDREAVRTEWLRCVAATEAMDIEHRWRRHDGLYRWIRARVEPLRDERGRVVRWYGLLVDVDDWKRAEEALRRSQAQLAHVTRLTSMGELTASIAHEVNQPLTAIVNNANACLGLMPNAARHLEDMREALSDIVDAADRASRIIARVRHLATKAPFEAAALDVNGIVTDVVALARHESVSRGVAIRTELPDELPQVVGDRVQLQQVLLNLLVNGLDAMSGVEKSARVLTIRGHSETNDGRSLVVLAVRDAGTGIVAGAAGRLFEAFYTTKPHGMGMGLAISRSIVEAHGGRLWAEPNTGPGATFAFALPAVAAMQGRP